MLLEKGPTSISALARLLSVERVTVYAALDRLKAKGLMTEGRESYSRTVRVEPPSRVLDLLEERRTELFYETKSLEDALPRLLAEYAAKGQLAAFRLFEGRKQFLAVFEEAPREAPGEILYYGDAQAFVDYVGIDYENHWVRKRVRRKVQLQMLVFSTNYIHERYKQIDLKELRETRYISGKPAFKSSFMVYGAKTLLWNPVAERAIVIDDPMLTDMFRWIFASEWDAAKRS